MTRPVLLSVFSLALIALFSWGLSCTTIPAGKNISDWLAIFPEDVSFYLYLESKATGSILKEAIKDSRINSPEVQQLLDLTQHIYLAVRLDKDNPPAIWLILLGNYPGLMQTALDLNKDWQRHNSKIPNWHNRLLGLNVGIPQDYLIIISSSEIDSLLARAQNNNPLKLKHETIQRLESYELALLFPLGLDDSLAEELGIGIRGKVISHLWLGAQKDNDYFNFGGVFTLAPQVNAEAFKKLLEFSLRAVIRNTEDKSQGTRLNSLVVSRENNFVSLHGLILSSAELTTLLKGLLQKGPLL